MDPLCHISLPCELTHLPHIEEEKRCICVMSLIFVFFCLLCEWEGDVVAVVASLGGVAQVVSHGVKVVGVHGEEGEEKEEEVQVGIKGEVEENQGQLHIMDDMQKKVTDSRTT